MNLHCFTDGRDARIIRLHWDLYLESLNIPTSVKKIVDSYLPSHLELQELFIACAGGWVSGSTYALSHSAFRSVQSSYVRRLVRDDNCPLRSGKPPGIKRRRLNSKTKDSLIERLLLAPVGCPSRSDKKLVIWCVSCEGSLLEYASDSLKDDVDVVSSAILQSPKSLDYASLRLQKDEGVIAFTSKTIAIKIAHNPKNVAKRIIVPDAIALRKDALSLALQISGKIILILPEKIKKNRNNIQLALKVVANKYATRTYPMYYVKSCVSDLPVSAFTNVLIVKQVLNHRLTHEFPVHKCSEAILRNRKLIALAVARNGVRWKDMKLIPFCVLSRPEFVVSCLLALTATNNVARFRKYVDYCWRYVTNHNLTMDDSLPFFTIVKNFHSYCNCGSRGVQSQSVACCHTSVLRYVFISLFQREGIPMNKNTGYECLFNAYFAMYQRSMGDFGKQERSIWLLRSFVAFVRPKDFGGPFWMECLKPYTGEKAFFVVESQVLEIAGIAPSTLWRLTHNNKRLKIS